MENVKEPFWAEGTAEEIGEIISVIRKDFLKKTPKELAEEIESKADTIDACESGKSAHGFSLLKKMCEKFNLNLELVITSKE